MILLIFWELARVNSPIPNLSLSYGLPVKKQSLWDELFQLGILQLWEVKTLISRWI